MTLPFNWKDYVDLNPDLYYAGIRIQVDATKHWNDFGCRENRATHIPPDFLWENYVWAYDDLIYNGISTRTSAYRHWITKGQKDGRVIPSQVTKPVIPTRSRIHLGVCCVFRDQVDMMKEWIEYNLLIGVQHLFLLNNDPFNDYSSILKPYILAGIVSISYCPIDFYVSGGGNTRFTAMCTQFFHKTVVEARGKVTWIALLDSDEFMVPHQHNTMNEFLKQYENDKYGGVCLNWRMYGTSDIPKKIPETLYCETNVLASKVNHHTGSHVKSIVRPERVANAGFLHIVRYVAPYYAVLSNHQRVDKPVYGPICYQHAQLNHYFNRTEEYLINSRIKRDSKWANNADKSILWTTRNEFNQVEDRSIFRFIPALKTRMGML